MIALAVVRDRLRWRNSWVGMGVESANQAEEVVAALARRGLEGRAGGVPRVQEGDGQMVQDHRVIVRQRDRDDARQALSEVPRRGADPDQDGPST